MLTRDSLATGLGRIASHVESAADELNTRDGELGDGDLGVTLVRGGREVSSLLPDLPADLGQALLQVAQAFTRASGSSFGTLTATGLMAAAKAVKGRETVPCSEVPGLLRAAIEAMRNRGKADLGDKTVLDAMDAAAAGAEGLEDPGAMRTAMLGAVDRRMDEMRDQRARVGRARIFAEKSEGRDDPGMVAFRHMLAALGETGKD